MGDEEQEFISCRARIARNCEQRVQIEMADEDSTFNAEEGTFVCGPCWTRACEAAGGWADDIDEAVRIVQDDDRNEGAASER